MEYGLFRLLPIETHQWFSSLGLLWIRRLWILSYNFPLNMSFGFSEISVVCWKHSTVKQWQGSFEGVLSCSRTRPLYRHCLSGPVSRHPGGVCCCHCLSLQPFGQVCHEIVLCFKSASLMTNNEYIFHNLFYQLYFFWESVFMSFVILIRLFEVFFVCLFLTIVSNVCMYSTF